MNNSKTLKKSTREKLEFAAFVFPILIFLFIIEFLPFIKGILYSMTDWNGFSTEWNYIGLTNYANALKSGSDFWRYFGLTIKYVLIIVPVSNIIAIILADILCSTKIKVATFSRVTFFTPNVLSATVIAFLWKYLFSTILSAIGEKYGIEWLQVGWLGKSDTAILATIIVSIWSTVGFNMIIFIAGLQSIDDNILEAARMDGTNAFQQFIHIKLPMLMSSITICLFLSLSNTFKMFDMPFFLTAGGPGDSTTTIPIDIYNTGILQHKYGESTAIAVLLFLIVLIITMIQTSVTKKMEVD